jgi:hypothetical protein
VVAEKTALADDVCQLRIESATSLYYHAGQFINLRRADGLTRSYSLASLPMEDGFLELHVKRMPGGAMSQWIHDELAVGDELELQGPHGGAPACLTSPPPRGRLSPAHCPGLTARDGPRWRAGRRRGPPGSRAPSGWR